MPQGIPFVTDMDVAYGRVDRITPGIRRVLARNPGPLTFHGTGTYILGAGDGLAVIDPGPPDDDHLAALLAAVEGETVSHIVVTHTHMDHSPAARPLQDATGAPTYGFGPHGAGRAFPGGPPRGADMDFTPDVTLADGDVIAGPGWTLEAVHTPGHASNHLCFAYPEERTLFTGDHVMGWSTTVISPPDGDMGTYLASLETLLDRDAETIYWPTHGPAITDPKPHVRALIAHRAKREDAILMAMGRGCLTVPAIVAHLYRGVPPALHPAAARTVLAHLIHMVETGRVACDGPATAEAAYRIPR